MYLLRLILQTVLCASGQCWKWDLSFQAYKTDVSQVAVLVCGNACRHWFRTQILAHGKGHPKTCGGVAGATQALTLVDLPTCIAGHWGISRWDVMCDRGSSSDPIGSRVLVRMPGRGRDFVSQGVIRFEKLQDDETTIMRLPSGHCSEKLMKFPRTGCHPPSTSNTELGGHPFTMRLLGET